MSLVWIIGSGEMAIEYSKVLLDIGVDFLTIGRGEESALRYKSVTGIDIVKGGLSNFLKTNTEIPRFVIVAVSIESLSEICNMLIDLGVENILLEKPGVGEICEIENLYAKSKISCSKIFIAYNRRFYTAVQSAKKLIELDGGVLSFHFEFTEWSHQIRNLKKHKIELENWFLGNSTHVIDTAFFLCGRPTEMTCYYKGGNDWHPKPTIFSGAGISENGALFSYEANWESPGRWNIDIMTDKHRYILKPMEKLQIQNIGSINVSMVENIDYTIDEKFKPGLYNQTLSFLNSDFSIFCTLEEQYNNFKAYKKMSGY